MELWDLYDRDGNRTGQTFERGHEEILSIPDGLYHIVTAILVRHKDGTFLLMKRDENKDVYPGFWEASAGGSALVGENPEECARRELLEETGIRSENFTLINKVFRDKSHSVIYCYITDTACDKDSIVLQEGETIDYKWVDAKGLIEYSKSDLAIKSNVERFSSFYESLADSL